MSAVVLYHYTCAHSRVELGDDGLLLPTADRADVSSLGISAWPSFFVWLTDQTEPDADALGLTRHHIKCDRTEHRYRVTDTSGIVPWLEFIANDPGYASVAMLLESPGADPSAWWVSKKPVAVTYDPQPGRGSLAGLFRPTERQPSDLDQVSQIVAARWTP